MSVSLKIHLVDLSTTKTQNYPTEMYISDICKDLRAKFNYGEGGQDHGLLFKEEGIWLSPIKMLGHYDLKYGDLLEFKKKHRILKVKTLDDSVKNILVDDSSTVKMMVEAICERMGLANPEEYSLMHPEDGGDKSKDKKKENKAEKKAESMTADSKAWLNPDKTLREQGLTEDDYVILKKKFFVTDQNVDRSDPVQLMMMYTQGYDMIISGKLPCTSKEAAQFGGIAMQIKYGNHDPSKHKPGFAKLSELVPPEYRKDKEVEKAIYREHSILSGATELNAKFRYVQLVRSLKTYGTSFFLVKESNPKTKKKADALLGITKQAVVRMDLDSKEILNEWKLTKLRRWAATPKNFTLDFGDYADAYYQVETVEGEEISRLIAGYIDIIIKKRQQLSTAVETKVDEQAFLEDYVKPGQLANVAVVSNKATPLKPGAIARAAGEQSELSASMGGDPDNPEGAVAEDLETVENQSIILQNIKQALESLAAYHRDVEIPMQIPMFSNDSIASEWKNDTKYLNRSITDAHVGNALAEIASLLLSTKSDVTRMDYNQMRTSILGFVDSTGQAVQSLKVLNALEIDDGPEQRLVKVAQMLTESMSSMLKELKPIVSGHSDISQFHELAENTGKVGAKLLEYLEQLDITENTQQVFKSSAIEVNDLLSAVTVIAKSTKQKKKVKEEISKRAVDCKEIAKTMVTCTNMLSGVLSAPVCRIQSIDSAVTLRDVVGEIHLLASSGDQNSREILDKSISGLMDSLSMFVERARNVNLGLENEVCDFDSRIQELNEELKKNINDKMALFGNAKDLAIDVTKLGECLKLIAKDLDKEEKTDLLASAQTLSELAQKMVAATKGVITNPSNELAKNELLQQVANLTNFSNQIATPFIRSTMLQNLRRCFKGVISTSNLLISAARASGPSNRDRQKQAAMHKCSKDLTEIIPQGVKAIYNWDKSPNDYACKIKLVQKACEILAPARSFAEQGQDMVNSVTEKTAKQQLEFISGVLSDEVESLEHILNLCEQLSMEDDFAEMVGRMKMNERDRKQIDPIVDEMKIGAHTKELQGLMKKIMDSKNVGENFPALVAEYQAILDLTGGLMMVSDETLSKELLSAAKLIGNSLSEFVTAVDKNGDPEDILGFYMDAVQYLLSNLPQHRAMHEAIGNIKQITNQSIVIPVRASSEEPSVSATEDFETRKHSLLVAASDLSYAAGTLVQNTRGNVTSLKDNIQKFEESFKKLVGTSGALKMGQGNTPISQSIQQVGLDFGVLMDALLSNTIDSSVYEDQLTVAAQKVGSTIDNLIGMLAGSDKGLENCNKAQQLLNAAVNHYKTCNDPLKKKKGYQECRNGVEDSKEDLKKIVEDFIASVKTNDIPKAAVIGTNYAEAIEKLIKYASNCIFLLSNLDPDSTAAEEPALDASELESLFSQAKLLLERAPKRGRPRKEVITDSSKLMDLAAEICNICENGIKLLKNEPKISAKLLNISKIIAANATSVSPAIRSLATEENDYIRNIVKQGCAELMQEIEKLEVLANSSAIGGKPVKPTSEFYSIHEKFIKCSESMVNNAKNAISSVQSMLANSNDLSQENLPKFLKNSLGESQKLWEIVLNTSPGDRQCQKALENLKKHSKNLLNLQNRAKKGQLTENNEIADVASFIEGLHSISDWITAAVGSNYDIRKLLAVIEELPEKFELVFRTNQVAVGVRPIIDCLESNSEIEFLQMISEMDEKLTGYIEILQNHSVICSPLSHFLVEQDGAELLGKVKSIISFIKEHERSDPKVLNSIAMLENAIKKFPDATDSTGYSWLRIQNELNNNGNELNLLITKAGVESGNSISNIALSMSDNIIKIMRAANTAHQICNDEDVKKNIRQIVEKIGFEGLNTIRALMQSGGDPANEPKIRSKLFSGAKEIKENLKNLDQILNNCTAGISTSTMINREVEHVVEEIGNAIIFANAHQLLPVSDLDNFSAHREGLINATKKLADTFKSFSEASRLNQDTLATLVTSAGDYIKQFSIKSTQACASLGTDESDMQVSLLECSKNIVISMQAILEGAKGISGCTDNNDLLLYNQMIKEKLNSFQPLFNTIQKSLDANENRGWYRPFERSLKEANATMKSDEPPLGTAVPMEMVDSSNQLIKSITALVAKSAASPEELFAALNNVKEDVFSITRMAKILAATAPNGSGNEIIEHVSAICSIIELLANDIRIAREENDQISMSSDIQNQVRALGGIISSLVKQMGNLVPEGYVDPNDPNVIAERELLSAANAIEAAARKLNAISEAQALKPREANEELDFEEQIIEAARAIASASSALVRSATGVQREIVAKGKAGPKEEAKYFSDGTWSDGLVSAAKFVVETTNDLCDSANQFIKESGPLEKVTVGARNVSAATVQLLAAASVRSDPNSTVQLRLRAAGKAVTDATEQLVISSKNARPINNEKKDLVISPTSAHHAKIAEMEIQMKILRLEKELEQARSELAVLRKNKYDSGANKDLKVKERKAIRESVISGRSYSATSRQSALISIKKGGLAVPVAEMVAGFSSQDQSKSKPNRLGPSGLRSSAK